MHTHSGGQPLEPIDLEIEASNRRRNAQRRLNQRILVASSIQNQPSSPIQRAPSPIRSVPHSPIHMENPGANNGVHQDPLVIQLQQQLEALQKQLNDQNADQPAVVPIQNLFVHRTAEDPPVGNHINANTFELKFGLIQMAEANAFGGRATEDANKHLTKFIQISNTLKHNGVPENMIRLRLFPFSLRDAATDWYDSLAPDSIPTWDEMVKLFLDKYFPPSEALKRQAEII